MEGDLGDWFLNNDGGVSETTIETSETTIETSETQTTVSAKIETTSVAQATVSQSNETGLGDSHDDSERQECELEKEVKCERCEAIDDS